LINCTDALEFIVGLTGVCKLRKPPKTESLDNCTDACLQPTLNPSLSFWVHCTDAIIGRGEQNPLADDMQQAVNYLSQELYSKDIHFLMELVQVIKPRSQSLAIFIQVHQMRT
jgi:hypothetical protein